MGTPAGMSDDSDSDDGDGARARARARALRRQGQKAKAEADDLDRITPKEQALEREALLAQIQTAEHELLAFARRQIDVSIHIETWASPLSRDGDDRAYYGERLSRRALVAWREWVSHRDDNRGDFADDESEKRRAGPKRARKHELGVRRPRDRARHSTSSAGESSTTKTGAEQAVPKRAEVVGAARADNELATTAAATVIQNSTRFHLARSIHTPVRHKQHIAGRAFGITVCHAAFSDAAALRSFFRD